MKRIIRVFPVFTFLCISLLIINLNDMQQRKVYKEIQSFIPIGFDIPNNVESITDAQIETLFDYAADNDVILVKTIYNEDTDSIDNYITSNDIVGLLSNQFNIAKQREKAVISTYKVNDPSVLYIPDFLNNDRYTFYPISYIEKNNIYKRGSYELYYQNIDDCYNFIETAESILHIPAENLYNESLTKLQEHTDIVLIGMALLLFFFSIFYFILVLFLCYKDSKKIGVLSLLGFVNKDILIYLNKNYYSFLSILLLTISLGSLLLPNAKINLFLTIITVNILVIMLTIMISYLALNFIYRYTTLSNILKKQSIAKKISNVCLIAKFIMVGSIALFSINVFPSMIEMVQNTNILKESSILMDYATFPRLRIENSEYQNSENYLKFYHEIINDEIDHIYVRFDDYLETDAEVIQNFENMESNGNYYRYASVDNNYINKYDLTYYNEKIEEIDLDLTSINQEVFLLPRSKRNDLTNFKNYISRKYENYQIKSPVVVYFYNDRTFDTFDVKSGIKRVESPILRIIHKNNPYSYIDKSYGIDVAGTGMSTGLKFRITENDADLFKLKLAPCIEKAGLENVLVEENFVSYKEYYSDEIANAKRVSSIFFTTTSIALFIYLVLIIQTFSLFVEARKNEILVKSILGFTRIDIFYNVMFWNILTTIVSLIGILSYVFFSGTLDLSYVLITSLILILLDILLVLIIASTVRINSAYSLIKGE